MARTNRIFISFAMEDEWARIRLGGQAKNERTPFDFVDMSAKKPWDEAWKTQCRSRIKGCDGVIALVSNNTAGATGELWEIKTAREERVPVMGMYISQDNRPVWLPPELSGVLVVDWTWDNIKNFLDRI
ncbi:TIR domain-containing protein [Bradyrhizobium vignae]|uniref:Thoeris protein ThsB TIR-like domain-containing protein n=1 Tax=Bradyrhizobium vignae TaxID=1549949 RepID=A0A2U3PUB2_9BRAD|nr:TIR domain-containing protein [Bradyrhizobium vignae]SPP92761.1 conserved protein of unknown function [Bradyrhizobium vignae]